MNFAERYRAIAARDRRFDGRFITAVPSTGIYCRPSCPARTPKESNVVFYETSAAAHEAGFRACKRCLPEATPGSPDWNVRHDLAARAMRLIGDGVVDREGVAGLGRRLGYSSRQLTRVLATELGAGPLALARATRATTARQLLVETGLPIADVAFAAGFASVRQFNATVREVYALTPSALRATAPRGAAPASEIRLRLPVREPFDARGTLRFLAARAVPGVEWADATSYGRLLALPAGAAEITVDPEPDGVRVALRMTALSDLGAAIARVRRLLDLDADPVAIDTALTAHPQLAGAVRATPGLRMPGATDGDELLLRALIGQQISVAAARTHLARLAELGEPAPADLGADPRLSRVFPTAAAVAAHGRELLRGPARRTEAILGAAEELAEGRLTVDVGAAPEELRERLLALPGVGPWTAGYVAMRALGDPDSWLPGDAAVRTGAARLGTTPDELERLSPWRSYAIGHAWRAALATPKEFS